MKRRVKIISLTANLELAKSISRRLNVPILDTKVSHFADGEILFECNETFRGDDVYIIQSTCCPVTERLMELLICIDALKRASAKSVNVVIPYFGYARQERKAKPRQPITAKLVANLIMTAGADRVICMDLHAAAIQGFFDIPVDDISAINIFSSYFEKMKLKKIACVSPDHGGVLRASRLAEKLNASLVIIDKRRTRPNVSEIVAIVGNVRGKNCIIVDDIADTAGTLCHAADKLKELGAKKVFAVITHGILSGNAINNINNSGLDQMVITDTIPLSKEKAKACKKIKVLSVATLLSDVIKAISEGTSLSFTLHDFSRTVHGKKN
ncbi:MAG: ribose-phosphate pyrophosphokinase [Bacilli bacterium]|nr:ribose-phosphate pyrophosphokinase [Bacilli bacterium]